MMQQLEISRRIHSFNPLGLLQMQTFINSYQFIFNSFLSFIAGYIGSYQGFPDSSVGKESACNTGDPGLIPGSGRSPGEGVGYALWYSWASLVAQLVKNPPAMWETWV